MIEFKLKVHAAGNMRHKIDLSSRSLNLSSAEYLQHVESLKYEEKVFTIIRTD